VLRLPTVGCGKREREGKLKAEKRPTIEQEGGGSGEKTDEARERGGTAFAYDGGKHEAERGKNLTYPYAECFVVGPKTGGRSSKTREGDKPSFFGTLE